MEEIRDSSDRQYLPPLLTIGNSQNFRSEEGFPCDTHLQALPIKGLFGSPARPLGSATNDDLSTDSSYLYTAFPVLHQSG